MHIAVNTKGVRACPERDMEANDMDNNRIWICMVSFTEEAPR